MVNIRSRRLRRLASILSHAFPPLAKGGKGRHQQARWDWQGWIALAWVLWFGWLYSLMVLETKFPQVLAWLRRAMAVSASEH